MKIGFLLFLGIAAITTVSAAGGGDLAKLRSAMEQYQNPDLARAGGYFSLSGFDTCNAGFGGSGYHYVNLGLIDTTVDLLHPEAMIYVPDSNGKMQLSGVEYIVPVAAWTAVHPSEWPHVMNQQFHLNSVLGVYILRVWAGKDNPSGMFEDWNPNVSCS